MKAGNSTLTFFILIIITLFLSCGPEAPVISSIDPKIGRMGEVITLTGSLFGESRDESYVTIAGISPTNSSYQVWQDDLIVVRVPELGESGLVYVHARGVKSNGVLFSNINTVPRPAEGEDFSLVPRITSISPQSGVPGSVMVISGSNFGASRDGGVFFSWDFESGVFNPYIIREPEYIEVSEIELGYESWSAREIRVRVPDGAISGNIEVRTNNGRSRPVFFDVSDKPGSKVLKDKRIYTITYSVDIRVLEATRPNSLYLWIPKPVVSPAQRNINLISRSAEPYMENYRGASLYKLDNLGTGANQFINLSFRLEVYAVETNIRPQSIRQEPSPLSAMYTQSSALIPCDDPQIKSAAASITGREQNPYLKSRMIYDWITANMQITRSLPSQISLINALAERQADPYTAMLLYTALSRAAGIPCIPIAGIYLDRSGRTSRHYWAEFWIDGFGWVPVDPAMGAGVQYGNQNQNEEGAEQADLSGYADFYFGNLDNQRIAFSRGDLLLSQMESKGRVVSHPQSYSLQNIWEEAVGGLESYSSFWSDISISGVYSQ
ncbi:MAG: IPT/TIG domain-containing protein [Treponema sp.]|nr:IPT/TIG domain-containing protein [Treponema sp.]